MRRFQRLAPEIDAYWASCVAFVLLIFFIVISSVNVDLGLQRHLPPSVGKYAPEKILPRNILNICLTDTDELICGNQVIGIGDLRKVVKAFISNPENITKTFAAISWEICPRENTSSKYPEYLSY